MHSSIFTVLFLLIHFRPAKSAVIQGSGCGTRNPIRFLKEADFTGEVEELAPCTMVEGKELSQEILNAR